MSFDKPPMRPGRVAIIGGGISGLAAAYLLAPHREVTLYEAAPRLGGHARTVMAGRDGTQAVDTGFIVFNYATYPHLTRMFQDLDVPVARSDMSFGASIDGGRIEYGLRDLRALLAQRRNLARPGFHRMVRDIFRFNGQAPALAGNGGTIGELMERMRLGDWFQRYYLTPLCGAIWSTPTETVRDFPARALVRFMENHALMSPAGQHQWYTVDGGSTQYVGRVARHLLAQGATLRTGTPVRAVTRQPDGVQVHTGQDAPGHYDQVILACHADQALRLLGDAAPEETTVLSKMRFQDNRMVLHRDAGQMPHRRQVWSSWVYRSAGAEDRRAIGVTYWMNRLQNIPESDPLFVTLNPATPIPEAEIYDETTFRHPVFDEGALQAQARLPGIQGLRRTWFAGAYTRNGFHEDGFASAHRVVRAMDRLPA